MLLEDMPLYAPEAQRALKLLALTITKAGDDYLSKRAPDFRKKFPRQTHWSIAALPVFFFEVLCAARSAIDELGATDTVLQIMREHYPNGLDFIAYLDQQSATRPDVFSEENLTELLDGLDFWPGDAHDYAKIRLRKPRQKHWADTKLRPGTISTLDMMFWLFHTAAPGDLVENNELTPFYQETEKLSPGLYSKFLKYHRSNPKPEDRQTVILEVRKRKDAYKVSLLSSYGTFTQFGSGDRITANPAQLFIPCKPPVFLASEVNHFEQLINETGTQRELQLQRFLESHSHFLRVIGSQGFRPQVHLVRQEIDDLSGKRANLRPDFIVEQLGLTPHAILEIKKAQAHMTAGPADRRNYSAQLFTALRQLDDYWNFFKDSSNRRWFANMYGEEIADPELLLLMGSEDVSDGPLRNLVFTPTENRPVRLLTYSDILTFVRCQHLILPG